MRTLLLDIDDTLLNTKKLISIINKQVLAIIKLSEPELQALLNQYFNQLNTNFTDPEDYCNYLTKKLNFSAEKKQQLLDVFFKKTKKYQQSLFDDTKVIPYLAQQHRLGIFSQGGKKWQNVKWQNSGLEKFFQPNLIFISENKTQLESITQLPAKAVIIDNDLQVVDQLLEQQLQVIWLNRLTTDKHQQCQTIFSLNELK